MIHCIAADDVVTTMCQMINEATVTNGRYISIQQLPGLPESVKKKIYDSAIKHKIFTKGDIKESDEPFALLGQDVLDSAIQYTLEDYDKDIDEAIMTSEDIIKAYNEMISAHFDKAVEALKRLESAHSQSKEDHATQYNLLNHSNVASATKAIQMIESNDAIKEMPEADRKKIICEAIYRPSDDPEEIKRIVSARISYNNAVINMLKNMLQVNYQLLGMSKDEAILLSQKLDSSDSKTRKMAIADVKKIVTANKAKFTKGNMVDLRSLGGGVCIQTSEDIGNMNGALDFDRIIQVTMTHDCVVVGHGGSDNDKAQIYIQKARDKLAEDIMKRNKENAAIYKERRERREQLDKMIKDFQAASTPVARAADNTSADNERCKKLQQTVDQLEDEQDTCMQDYKKHRAELTQKKESILKQLESGNIGQEEADEAISEIDEELSKILAERKQRMADLDDQLDALCKMLSDLEKKIKDSTANSTTGTVALSRTNEPMKKELPPEIKKLQQELKRLDNEIARIEKANLAAHSANSQHVGPTAKRIERRFKSENRWTIQQITTPGGKTCTDVNELVRTLIKEGFKDILLIACNPGEHTLAKDILDAKDVKIHHAGASLLAESIVIYHGPEEESLNEAWNALDEAEEHLIGVCDRMGINYFDDNLLTEAVVSYPELSVELGAINEGTISDVWNKLKELIKKAIHFLAGLFKKMIEMGKRVLDKVKTFFARIFQKPGVKQVAFKQPLRFGRIIVESAKADKVDTRSWGDLEKAVIPACESISKKISNLERQQVSNMEELSRYAESKARSIKESANPLFDRIITLSMT